MNSPILLFLNLVRGYMLLGLVIDECLFLLIILDFICCLGVIIFCFRIRVRVIRVISLFCFLRLFHGITLLLFYRLGVCFIIIVVLRGMIFSQEIFFIDDCLVILTQELL